VENKQVRRVLNLLHFTESLDDTQVTRKYPDLALKHANPDLLVFACSHKSLHTYQPSKLHMLMLLGIKLVAHMMPFIELAKCSQTLVVAFNNYVYITITATAN
jgi:hypothetical protein